MAAYRAISNGEALKAYAALAIPAIEPFGGRLLTGPLSQVEPHEAGLQLLTIIVEFESYDRAVWLTKARRTARRFRRSAPARNETSGLLKVCRSRLQRNVFARAVWALAGCSMAMRTIARAGADVRKR